MSTTFNQSFQQYDEQVSRSSFLKRFITWCANQEEDRLLWIGIALFGHGCLLTPVTALLITATGTSMLLFMLAIFAMAMVLITNLAALPTKITIPVFALSILIDLGIILAAALS